MRQDRMIMANILRTGLFEIPSNIFTVNLKSLADGMST